MEYIVKNWKGEHVVKGETAKVLAELMASGLQTSANKTRKKQQNAAIVALRNKGLKITRTIHRGVCGAYNHYRLQNKNKVIAIQEEVKA